ncbi:MAG: heme ABC exporter ATP-binding protein CcmA [Proteobacteria bacterium]|nr:heme ABC exporter ATP-binding protein CcmA [Pseudomonadota bacterium]MDA0913667.1 heme ABC exporter ATP-binding protein CcmA [Pseudomonadota bacterium]MDA1032462.1 heme ABC exporter ATP-binding protein CcmA [Pseudomonadota bacterium]
MQARLTATDLACRRGERVLFRGLSLDLSAGDVLHVTGENGTGKTSLLRILAGLLSPYSGEVSHEGAIGMLDERPALDPDQPLGEALRFWQQVDGCGDPAETIAAMELVPLLEVPVRYLSTGQRKRAAMARLLCQQAPIWLLDEPLSGLDDRAQARIAEAVSAHAAAGGIVVLASHQPIAVERLRVFALAEYIV